MTTLAYCAVSKEGRGAPGEIVPRDASAAGLHRFVESMRALLREPDLVNRIAADASTPSLCIHCNLCMPTNFIGTHCPVIDEGSSRSATWGTPAGYA